MIKIRESFEKYARGGMKHGVFSILKNPTLDELKKLKKEESEHEGNITTKARGMSTGFYLRALLIKENIYVWFGDYAAHTDIAVELGFTSMENILCLILYTNKDCKIEEITCSNSSGKDFIIDSYKERKQKLIPIIKECRPLMTICASNVKMTLEMDY